MTVDWIPEALRDIAEIIVGLFELGMEPELIKATQKQIFQKAEWFADNLMAAKREPRFKPLDVRSGYAIKTPSM